MADSQVGLGLVVIFRDALTGIALEMRRRKFNSLKKNKLPTSDNLLGGLKEEVGVRGAP